MKKFIAIILTLVTAVTSICAFGAFSASAVKDEDLKDYNGFKYAVRPDGKTICVYSYNEDTEERDGTIKIPEKIEGKKVLVIYGLMRFADDGTTKLSIPRYVKKIVNPFLASECYDTKIAVSKYNEKYCSVKGMLMSASKKTLYWTPELYSDSAKTKVKVPNSVVNIGKSAYTAYNRHGEPKTSVTFTLPKGLKEIRSSAFLGVEDMRKITLPNGLKKIGNWALNGTGLKEISVPKSVTKIGTNAFGWYNDGKKVKNFVVKGYKGSAAEKYAKKYKFTFKALD